MDKFETQPDGTITQADPLDSGDPIHIIDLIMFRLRDFLDEYEFAEIEGFAKRAIRSENIDRLRAEVASLKEDNARLKAMPLASDPVRAAIYGEAIDRLNLQIAGNVSEIFDLTQQLAAANDRIKELEEEVANWSRNAWE